MYFNAEAITLIKTKGTPLYHFDEFTMDASEIFKVSLNEIGVEGFDGSSLYTMKTPYAPHGYVLRCIWVVTSESHYLPA